MMTVNRRQLLAGMGLTATGLAFGGSTASAQSGSLVVPILGGAWEQFWRTSLAPDFTAKTGIAVQLDVGNGRVWGANMRASGVQNSPYSVVMVNEAVALPLRKEGFFEKLDLTKVPAYNDLYPQAKRTDGWGAVAMIDPVGIAYRTDLVKTPPKSWRDLWENPEFKGRIGVYNFANVAGKMELMLASKIFGKDQYDVDAGFAALEKLGPVIQSDFNLSTGIANGEFIVSVFDFSEAARLRRQGLPIEMVAPAEGIMMFDQTVNIVAHGPAKDFAYQYIQYLLSPEAQASLAKTFFVTPTNSKVSIPDDLRADVPIVGDAVDKILTWDWAFMNENQAKFAETWARTIK